MIKFFNINSKETRVAETEPMIAAFYNSSDLGPNAHVGQDFGWRLAPETVVQLRRLQKDQTAIRNIAQDYQKLPENINDSDLLKWLSDQNDRKATGMDQTEEDFTREYEDEIRKIEAAEAAAEEEEASEETAEEVKSTKPKSTKKEGSNGKVNK